MKEKKGKPTTSTSTAGTLPQGSSPSLVTDGPQFAETQSSPDPQHFTVKHGSDKIAYSILDSKKGHIPPSPFPIVAGVTEPTLALADAYGRPGKSIVDKIQKTGQIVFHCVGDTGNTKGPKDENLVGHKMVADYDETDPKEVPSFMYHLGDVVYSFGEMAYYYDQFYDVYRDYPAPIFAIPGNHDGMASPVDTKARTLEAFLENFCTADQKPHRTREAGNLPRTAQIQPGVYFTLVAPYVRLLGLYSNCLEDPGIISDQGNPKFSFLGRAQVDFLTAALKRVAADKFEGAVIIAVHHPPYVAQNPDKNNGHAAGKHGGSPLMLKDIDSACKAAGVWPHAVLSGHAHNYQRFTRAQAGRETPYVVCGNSGHAVNALTKKGSPTLRTPVAQPTLSDSTDSITFENYDDQDFGYLRIIASDSQLRIEYHPAPDGADAKTPDDFVTVDLATHKLVHFQVPNA
jgi:hypothetical protein